MLTVLLRRRDSALDRDFSLNVNISTVLSPEFMQFDRSADGVLTPLPRPSVDTGAGLDRLAAVMEGVYDSFHNDLLRPLIADVERLVGSPYPGGPEGTGVSYRVLAEIDIDRRSEFVLDVIRRRLQQAKSTPAPGKGKCFPPGFSCN